MFTVSDFFAKIVIQTKGKEVAPVEYRIIPMGDIWQEGTVCIPKRIISSYIKMASEYQLKALLIIMNSDGISDSKAIARALGCTVSDADEFMDFWVEEGVLSADGKAVNPPPQKEISPKAEIKEEPQQVKATVKALPLPSLSPKDIVEVCRDSEELTELLRSAQEVLGRSLSHAEQEMLVNMVTYYGLPAAVVLTILHYYKTEKAKGKAIGTAYINAMAKNWAEEGICDLQSADEKLKTLEVSDRLWDEIVDLTGIRHRSPTIKQRETVKRWSDDFSMEMIALACDIMKENADRPSLNYIDKVLKNWKKKGISTPADVKADNEKHEKSKKKDSGDIESTYDIDEITKKAMFNENYDI